jgi:hypothetical protein
MGETPNPEIGALYAESPDRFVAARKELAARLGEAGDVRASKEVSALRKPTVAAWAVDRLALDHASDIEALIDVGKKLASAQREVAAGGGVDRLHEASNERRRLVERLVHASAGVLESAGMSAARATLDKVSNTLMAIATDEEAADRVRRGVLDKELPAPAGFGDDRLDTALLASVSELPKPSGAGGGPRKAAPAPSQQRREREVNVRAARLSSEARELEKEADRLERESKQAERESKQAEVKAAAAAKVAATARHRADAARRRADDAAS